MHNQHRSPDPTKIERATATSTVALFFYLLKLNTKKPEISCSTARFQDLPVFSDAFFQAYSINKILIIIITLEQVGYLECDYPVILEGRVFNHITQS